jgi:hypothetical protein
MARLNFSHGDFAEHGQRIGRIRAAERATGRRVAIMADLPGPKMRLGKIDPEPIQLRPGASFTLTTADVVGTERRVAMSFERLPQVVKPGDLLFLNDGLVQLQVEGVAGPDVQCRVSVGGGAFAGGGLRVAGVARGAWLFDSPIPFAYFQPARGSLRRQSAASPNQRTRTRSSAMAARTWCCWRGSFCANRIGHASRRALWATRMRFLCRFSTPERGDHNHSSWEPTRHRPELWLTAGYVRTHHESA